MVFTSPSRVSRLVHNDIDRLGSHSKFNPTRKELTLPSILEVNEDPLSSPSSSSSTRTTTPTDITTMSTLLQELMLTLVTASTTSASASSPNMTPVKVKKASSTSFPSPSRLSHFDLTEHDIDGLSHIAPSLATSPMRVPSRSVSVSPSSLTAITETNEEIIGTSMEQTSALLRRLSLSLENVINSTPREPLQSPLSCQQSQRESHAIMTSPHKLKIPISASSSASPNFSPDVSPRTHRGPMMII